MCQKASTDPMEVVGRHLDRLVRLIVDASLSDVKVGQYFATSRWRYITP